ncbi:hypothetical protein N658DRAFT_504535 [Parathielavia hyrcaniae]|uniref:Uncharacterized protein n=1 Tax=Parathielavia hyrcaniae TaxID=113614 RepID=A0AAN6T5R1_9PEZI|nr:hypothetical protein N658DRAFT_504535 [Parathielavia hyrcaniae]
MDLELSDIARAIGAVMGLLWTTFGFLATPVIYLLQGCLGVMQIILWPILGVARILISPFLLPWYITIWCWETALDLYDEFKPLLIYFSFAILIGAIFGVLLVILTNTLIELLHYYIPWLAPDQPHPQRRAASAAHRRHPIPIPIAPAPAPAPGPHHRHHDEPRGDEKEEGAGGSTRFQRVASLTSGSESDEDEEDESWNAEDALSRYKIAPPGAGAGAKSPRRWGTPPVRIRVDATIHEESSG